MRFVWEKVRTWKRDGFRLVLWDTNIPTGRGIMADTLLAFQFSDMGRVIFQGRNFMPPIGVAIDSDECVVACLASFTLKPGDVGEEFFDGCTVPQRAWLETGRADELYVLVRDVESSDE